MQQRRESYVQPGLVPTAPLAVTLLGSSSVRVGHADEATSGGGSNRAASTTSPSTRGPIRISGRAPVAAGQVNRPPPSEER
jgi:hypothetical protein